MSIVEKEPVQPARRSRRAASLTAQLLWNIQIEDDAKSVTKFKKEPSLEKEAENGNEKKCQKRVAGQTSSEHKGGKKQKMNSNGYSGCLFPAAKPLHSHAVEKPHKKKLTASVKPLVQTKSCAPRVVRPQGQNIVQHASPILLLPVSLKTNQGSAATTEVGSLPVFTFKNSSELMNCFGLNKSVSATGMNTNRSAWQNSNVEMVSLKPNTILLPSLSRAPGRKGGIKQLGNPLFGQSAQDEPLNLKMGETTIPSSSKQIFAPGRVKGGGKSVMTCTVSVPLPRTDVRVSVAQVTGNVRVDKPKDFYRGKPATYGLKGAKKPECGRNVTGNLLHKKGHSARVKQETNCPSPEYACSSPDVDDVHRDARHTCNRAHINLRQKAVPPPGTPEYEEYKAEQRRMLADAAMRENKRKLDTQKPLLVRMDSDEERPLLNPQNNGWTWTGKPYFGLVYSVENGKYVRRRCFPAMTRYDKDGLAVVMVRDCVFLCAGGDDELPYVAKVTGLWEKPHTGDMTMSLLWYYRPEHTEDPRVQAVNLCDDELFVSRHQDEISVACVEDRCHVLSYSEYCRVQARMRRDKAWKKYDRRREVPPLPDKRSNARRSLPGESPVDDSNLFFSRRIYDVKCRRVLKCLPPPGSLAVDYAKRTSTT